MQMRMMHMHMQVHQNLGGWSPGCFFSDYLLSRTGGCQYPNKTGVGCFIFTIAASNFFSMNLTAATCLNSRLLAVWCLKRKAGPDSEGEILWMHLLVDDYNLRHGE